MIVGISTLLVYSTAILVMLKIEIKEWNERE